VQNFVQHDAALVAEVGKNVGIFEGRRPDLITCDAGMIRFVLVQDFDRFTSRRVTLFPVNSFVFRSFNLEIFTSEFPSVTQIFPQNAAALSV